MAPSDDLKQHALSSTHDFYELLGIPPSAQLNEIRRAYRKTALKYHPDKVGPNDSIALEKFHLLQIAYDVLSDDTVRALHDNARRAREEKRVRDDALHGRRKAMKDDLERRESGFLKRKREEVDAEEALEREIRRIAEENRLKRKEREEQLRKEAQEEAEHDMDQDRDEEPQTATNGGNGQVSEEDRAVTLRFARTEATAHITPAYLEEKFSQQFGPVEHVLLRDKKIKVDGEKHRQLYTTAVLLFKSIVDTHKCISDLPELVARAKRHGQSEWSIYEAVGWASGKEPDYIPKSTPRDRAEHRAYMVQDDLESSPPAAQRTPERNGDGLRTAPATAPSKLRTQLNESLNAEPGLKKVPSFSSFKSSPKGGKGSTGGGTPSSEDLMMMRLRNAQKRREEERRIREEEARAESLIDES